MILLVPFLFNYRDKDESILMLSVSPITTDFVSGEENITTYGIRNKIKYMLSLEVFDMKVYTVWFLKLCKETLKCPVYPAECC